MDEKPNTGCCSGGSPVKIQTSSCCGQGAGDLPLINLESCLAPGIPGADTPASRPEGYWIEGFIGTPRGQIPRVGTTLVFRDTLGSWKARWGVNRMNYAVTPGLYGVGNPDSSSPVLVTANYKMTLDRLRKELKGLNVWILVLNTFGINVWCAAGKGTFGTEEIVRRVAAVGLSGIVSHRTLILPQLGAPGVAAHEVKKQTGFKVVYGPVRASDIKEFLKRGMKATPEMRAVTFGFMERLVLTPIELVNVWKPAAILAAALLIVHLTGLLPVSFLAVYPFIGAILAGGVLAPACLPWIPGRAFAWKGWLAGFAWTCAVLAFHGVQAYGTLNSLALLFVLPAISAYIAMNFTGASTYTSLSGVKREMRFAVPMEVALAVIGIGLWVTGLIA